MFVYKNLKDAAAFGVLGSLGYTVPVSRSGAPPPAYGGDGALARLGECEHSPGGAPLLDTGTHW